MKYELDIPLARWLLVFDCLVLPQWMSCNFVECSWGFVIFHFILSTREWRLMHAEMQTKEIPIWVRGRGYLHKNLTHPICLGGVADLITAHLTDNARFPCRGRGWPGIMLTMPMWISSALISLLRRHTITVNLISMQHNIVGIPDTTDWQHQRRIKVMADGCWERASYEDSFD